jgi:hypothetical protein
MPEPEPNTPVIIEEIELLLEKIKLPQQKRGSRDQLINEISSLAEKIQHQLPKPSLTEKDEIQSFIALLGSIAKNLNDLQATLTSKYSSSFFKPDPAKQQQVHLLDTLSAHLNQLQHSLENPLITLKPNR